jgi:hypothetical protein
MASRLDHQALNYAARQMYGHSDVALTRLVEEASPTFRALEKRAAAPSMSIVVPDWDPEGTIRRREYKWGRGYANVILDPSVTAIGPGDAMRYLRDRVDSTARKLGEELEAHLCGKGEERDFSEGGIAINGLQPARCLKHDDCRESYEMSVACLRDHGRVLRMFTMRQVPHIVDDDGLAVMWHGERDEYVLRMRFWAQVIEFQEHQVASPRLEENVVR